MLASISQAAKELGISGEHLRRMIRAGRWPAYQLGRKALRVDVDEIRQVAKLRQSESGSHVESPR